MSVADPTDDKASTATATLMVEVGERVESRVVVDGATVGRDPRSDVAIDHPTVSRAHARIERRADGWWFVDLGSQNGSMLRNAKVEGGVPIMGGAPLRIGRVRAWFFTGDGPPAGWEPGDPPQLSGKLMRCRCGHIGWAPSYAAGMTLTCGTCGRDVVVTDLAAPPAPVETTTASTCAGCHTEVNVAQRAHACAACGATMHADCWEENRGCAVYGCSQANVLDATSDATPQVDGDDKLGHAAAAEPASPAMLVAAQVGLLTLVSLPIFGVPAIAFGAYRLVGGGLQCLVVAVLAFAGGAAGFACSSWWWLGR